MLLLLLLAVCLTGCTAFRETSGFLTVRPGASMFYWLYMTGDQSTNFTSFPLMILLSGGPGSASSGNANLRQVGPEDVDLNPRHNSWLRYGSLLFFDSPVGTGYSHVQEGTDYPHDNDMVTTDFVTALTLFLHRHPEFRTTPTHIFGHSYSGKVAVAAAREIDRRVRSGNMQMNLKGIGLQGAFIAPMTITRERPRVLYDLSLIDDSERRQLEKMIRAIEAAVASGNSRLAGDLYLDFNTASNNMTFGVDFHNIVQPTFSGAEKLSRLFNSQQMRKRLNIPDSVTWSDQIDLMTRMLHDDALRSVTRDVDYLLRETDIRVDVFQGQMDLLITTAGTEAWIRELEWSGLPAFLSSPKATARSERGRTAAGFR